MIEVSELTKRYGSKCAVNNISFQVNPGEILGFLGPNGAGKSTTMNILTGYLSASSGVAKIGEFDVLQHPIEAKKQIGYLPEQPPLYPDMTVKDYLNFVFDLKKVSLPRKAHISEICELVKINDVYKRMIKNLSKGYKQRVGLAQAIMGNPEVLILDEPTVGLDPKQIIEIRNLIKSLGKNHTVILSTHILPEVSAVCDRILVINQGEIVADGTPDSISKSLSSNFKYLARIEAPEKEGYKLVSSLPHLKTAHTLGEKEPGVFEFSIEAEEGVDIRRELFSRLSDRGFPLLGLRSTEMTLEEVFLKLTMDHSITGGKRS